MGFTSHRILLCLTADFIRLDLLIYLEFDHPSSYVIGQIFLTKSGKRLSGFCCSSLTFHFPVTRPVDEKGWKKLFDVRLFRTGVPHQLRRRRQRRSRGANHPGDG